MTQDYREPFEQYLANNPGASFADYYVDFVDAAVKRGKVHRSIGPTCKDPALSAQRAEYVLERLKQLGITPTDHCVDMGCGSLGKAGPILAYINQGHYIGADVTERFWAYGLSRFDPAFLEDRQPHFFLLDDSYENKVTQFAPRFTFCCGVVNHIPATELDLFFRRFLLPLGNHGRGFFTFIERDSVTQINVREFAYTRPFLKEIMATYGVYELDTDQVSHSPNEVCFEKRL